MTDSLKFNHRRKKLRSQSLDQKLNKNFLRKSSTQESLNDNLTNDNLNITAHLKSKIEITKN